MVSPRWIDAVPVHGAAVQWCSPAALLPAQRKRSIRKRPAHYEPRGVWMAGALCSFVVGELDGLLCFRAHVQRGVRPRLSKAARTDLDDGNVPAVPGAGIRLQWIPLALEHAGLFCHQGGDGSRWTAAGYRTFDHGGPAW